MAQNSDPQPRSSHTASTNDGTRPAVQTSSGLNDLNDEVQKKRQAEESRRREEDAQRRQEEEKRRQEEERKRQEEERRRVGVCTNFFSRVFPEFAQTRIQTMCKDYQFLRITNQESSWGRIDAKDFEKCLTVNKSLNAPEDRYIYDCSSESYHQTLLMKHFPGCFESFKKHFSSETAYTTCRSQEVLSHFDSQEASQCLDILKSFKDKPDNMLRTCRSHFERYRIISSDFKSCVQEVRQAEFSEASALDFCRQERIQKAITSNNYNYCQKALKEKGLFTDSGKDTKAFYRLSICAHEEAQELAIRNAQCYINAYNATYRYYLPLALMTMKDSYNSDKNLFYFLNRDCRGEGPTSSKVAASPYLNLIKEINIHTLEEMRGNKDVKKDWVQIGGLSAVSFDEKTSTLYFLSDETSLQTRTPPRMYVFNLTPKFELIEKEIFPFTFGDQEPDIDPEGLVRLSSGEFIVSSEVGSNESSKSKDKKMLITNLNIFDSQGRFLSAINLPENFKTKYKEFEIPTYQPNYHDETKTWKFNPPSKADGPKYNETGNPDSQRLNTSTSSNSNHSSEQPEHIGGGVYRYTGPNGVMTYTNQALLPQKSNGSSKKEGTSNEPRNPKKVDSPRAAPSEGSGSYRDDIPPRETPPPPAPKQTEMRQISGLEFNKSLESLTVSPDEKFLFFANEGSLFQDLKLKAHCEKNNDDKKDKRNGKNDSMGGIVTSGRINDGYSYERNDRSNSSNCGKVIRIAKYSREDGDRVKFRYLKEFKYALEAEVDNGLSELLAINDNTLLALERSWDPNRQKVTSRIYKVTLKESSEITEKMDATAVDQLPVLEKTLVIDFDSILPRLAPGFKVLDNFEGLAFGPTLANGKRTLIVVSDNNFSMRQRTAILFFEINPALLQ